MALCSEHRKLLFRYVTEQIPHCRVPVPSGIFGGKRAQTATRPRQPSRPRLPLLVTNSEQTETSPCRAETRLLWYFALRFRHASVLQGDAFPRRPLLAGSLSKDGFDARCHSAPQRSLPYDSELIPVEALSTRRGRLLWCGTEFTFTLGCTWVMVVYPGMESNLKV